MTYETLAKLFYKDPTPDRFQRNLDLARRRLEAESTFRTGIASPSGDEFFLATPRELSVLNEGVLRKEREVAVALDRIPRIARGALVRSLVIDEVVCTNELEGVHSTRRQINELLEAAPPTSGDLERRRFRELARLYLELSDERHLEPHTPEDIRAVYDRLMSGENLGDDAPDGTLFRKGEMHVVGGNTRHSHAGLAPEGRIISALGQMLRFASSPGVPETYGALVSHFLFEYIHPFYDGNGRTGRYLLALGLSKPLSVITALSLSRTIAENKGPYYRAFETAELPMNHGELTHFVMQMLEYVAASQERVLSDLERKQARLDLVRGSLQGLGPNGALGDGHCEVLYLLAQYDLFGAFPDVSLRDMARHCRRSEQTVRNRTRELEELGLIRPVSRRPLRFVLSDKGKELLRIEG